MFFVVSDWFIRRSNVHLFHLKVSSSRNLGRYWPNQRLPFKSSQTGEDALLLNPIAFYLVHTERIFIWSVRWGIFQIYWKTFIFHKWKILLGSKCFMDFAFRPKRISPLRKKKTSRADKILSSLLTEKKREIILYFFLALLEAIYY